MRQLKFGDKFNCFNTILKCHGQTHTQTESRSVIKRVLFMNADAR